MTEGMTQGGSKPQRDLPWVRADPPFVWLSDEAGNYLSGALEPEQVCEVDAVGWRADGAFVANGLVLDGTGRTVGRSSGLLHPNGAQRVILEEAGFKQRRARLLDLEGRELGNSEVMGGYAGSYGRFSKRWSPSGKQLAIGAYQELHVVSFDPPASVSLRS
jgi:hypothetical protein